MTRDERGAGAVLTLGAVSVLFVCLAGAIAVIGWFSAIRHAEQIAEVAALAGASAAAAGNEPCIAAERAAQHNDAHLSRCDVRGSDTDVVVEVGITVAIQPDLGLAPDQVERLATAGTM